MKLAILQNSDVMEKKRIPDSDFATQNYTETSVFVLGQKKKLILLTCEISLKSIYFSYKTLTDMKSNILFVNEVFCWVLPQFTLQISFISCVIFESGGGGQLKDDFGG